MCNAHCLNDDLEPQEEAMNILFAVTTGRAMFSSVLDMIAENVLMHGHTNAHNIGVMINYDTTFHGLSDEHFVYQNHDAVFSEVTYASNTALEKYKDVLRRHGLSDDAIRGILQPAGYGNKKNIILMEAIARGYDLVVFWDDDEYPVACMRSKRDLEWIHTDILGAHLSSDRHIDIAFGFRTGHVSPIPPNIVTYLSRQTARLLGQAFAVGNDVITETSFVNPQTSFVALAETPTMQEIEAIGGGKWIYGGNLSMRTKSILQGTIPPFYTPAGSRGDDTILAMRILDAAVFRVPSGIFHDCFHQYQSISQGHYPDHFDNSAVDTERSIQRFGAALKGWLAYAPLLIRLREGSNYRRVIDRMRSMLELVDRRLYRELTAVGEHLGRQPLSHILGDYADQVDRQYEQLMIATESWHKLMHQLR
jgi:hypothetical protein